MILTFSPNPALERVALVEEWSPGSLDAPGEPKKPMRVSTFAGGASLRAATVARLLGGEVLALGFVGGHLGALLRDCLEKQDVPHVLTPITANTRGGFLLLDREKGVVTDIPERAPVFTDGEADKLLATLDRHLNRAQILLVADGPSAHDAEADNQSAALFSRALSQAHDQNVPVLADVSGAAWPAILEKGAWLLRVNLLTLQKRSERSLQHDSAIIDEAKNLLAGGKIQNVVVTLGEEGALLVAQEGGAWRVKAPVVSHFNPTGSGETLSGALAVQYLKTGDLVEAVRYGCAAASVNVTHDEPGHATPGEVGVLFPRTLAGPVIQR